MRRLPVEHRDDVDAAGRGEQHVAGLEVAVYEHGGGRLGPCARSHPSTTSSSGNGSSCSTAQLRLPVVDRGGGRGRPGAGSASTVPSPAARQSTGGSRRAARARGARTPTRRSSGRSPFTTNQSQTPPTRSITTAGRSSHSPSGSMKRARGAGTSLASSAAQHGELLAPVGDEDAADRVAPHDQLGLLRAAPTPPRHDASNGQFSREPRRRAAQARDLERARHPGAARRGTRAGARSTSSGPRSLGPTSAASSVTRGRGGAAGRSRSASCCRCPRRRCRHRSTVTWTGWMRCAGRLTEPSAWTTASGSRTSHTSDSTWSTPRHTPRPRPSS